MSVFPSDTPDEVEAFVRSASTTLKVVQNVQQYEWLTVQSEYTFSRTGSGTKLDYVHTGSVTFQRMGDLIAYSVGQMSGSSERLSSSAVR